MAKWLGQGRETFYHDLEVMDSNSDQVELEVSRTSKSHLNQK